MVMKLPTNPIGEKYPLTAIIVDEFAQYLIEHDRITYLICALHANKCDILSSKTAHMLIGHGYWQTVQRFRHCFDIISLSDIAS
jgi:hypothetical protein